MSKHRIIEAKKLHYLFCPHKAGLGITYNDPRFPKAYDIGLAKTGRGDCIITWGLNLAAHEIPENMYAVRTAENNHEIILEERI